VNIANLDINKDKEKTKKINNIVIKNENLSQNFLVGEAYNRGAIHHKLKSKLKENQKFCFGTRYFFHALHVHIRTLNVHIEQTSFLQPNGL
jgi:hypothetical protein